ncbi:hypothetical protein PUN28_000633 [Cardiocondyla obscurior]|uniref:Uncharacterized protein n=1 Tax=Cardiocondyla obscurior TaxID=286306 RepID=A0AAW2H0Y9_9HYME
MQLFNAMNKVFWIDRRNIFYRAPRIFLCTYQVVKIEEIYSSVYGGWIIRVIFRVIRKTKVSTNCFKMCSLHQFASTSLFYIYYNYLGVLFFKLILLRI